MTESDHERDAPASLRVLFWGTYDRGKPRVRILEQGLRENGVRVATCHADVWGDVEDKSQITGFSRRLGRLWRWLSAYPRLIRGFLAQPAHDVVLVSYMGQLDVLVLWPFARWRRVPVVWDAFLSLYDTVVHDRKLIGPRHPVALLLYAWEWLACRCVSLVLLDTRAHADWFADCYRIPRSSVASVWVGAETERFVPAGERGNRPPLEPLRVLFYGQFIPLHGIATIVEAARLCAGAPIEWTVIGTGQEAAAIQANLQEQPVPELTWIPWVPYEELITCIHRADVCLGIFGTSDKASRVIPNKVFQALAAGCPVLTRDSPAIRELDPNGSFMGLVPAGDASTLANAILTRAGSQGLGKVPCVPATIRQRISPSAIGAQLTRALGQLPAWNGRNPSTANEPQHGKRTHPRA